MFLLPLLLVGFIAGVLFGLYWILAPLLVLGAHNTGIEVGWFTLIVIAGIVVSWFVGVLIFISLADGTSWFPDVADILETKFEQWEKSLELKARLKKEAQELKAGYDVD